MIDWPPRPPYMTVHSRLRAQRGPASRHLCVDCGKQADAWTYDYSNLGALDAWVDERSGPYTSDLSRYEPRCRSCHQLLDRRMRHGDRCIRGHQRPEGANWCPECKAEANALVAAAARHLGLTIRAYHAEHGQSRAVAEGILGPRRTASECRQTHSGLQM